MYINDRKVFTYKQINMFFYQRNFLKKLHKQILCNSLEKGNIFVDYRKPLQPFLIFEKT